MAALRNIRLAAVAALVWAPGAVLSDEVYLCENGRLVKVKFGELETLKRTDPCIAGYFGLAIAPPAPALPGKTDVPAKTGLVAPRPSTVVPHVSAPAPTPASKPDLRGAAEERAAAEPVTDRKRAVALADDVPTTDIRNRRNARLNPDAPLPQALRADPVAAPGTDYRNVRIINAEPGAGTWYRHTR